MNFYLLNVLLFELVCLAPLVAIIAVIRMMMVTKKEGR